MPRFVALLPLFSFPLALIAQTTPADYSLLEEQFRVPKNNFSVALRYTGRASVRFGHLGTINSTRSPGSATDEAARTYDDGSMGIDTRTTTEGVDLADDGRTNTWSYSHAGQVTSDESSIVFHTYSSTSNGAGVYTSSGSSPGIDIEYARQFGSVRPRSVDASPVLAWGFLFGFALNDVNLKTRGTIKATLNTLTDTYSLLGAAVPVNADGSAGYTAPSSVTETVTAPDGTASTFTIDTTTLLANRPDSRLLTEEVDQAEIDGFWQVKGAYLTLRTGPWVRWQPVERLSFRFSLGASVSLMGLHIRYDERLQTDSVLAEIKANEETKNEGFGIPGYFGGLDAEWWLTKRTGFFGGASFDGIAKDAELSAGDRTADVRVSSGLGLRIGITTRF